MSLRQEPKNRNLKIGACDRNLKTGACNQEPAIRKKQKKGNTT